MQILSLTSCTVSDWDPESATYTNERVEIYLNGHMMWSEPLRYSIGHDADDHEDAIAHFAAAILDIIGTSPA